MFHMSSNSKSFCFLLYHFDSFSDLTNDTNTCCYSDGVCNNKQKKT